MRPFVAKIIPLLVGSLLMDCATVFSDSYDDISITSKPEGAEVWLDGQKLGQTPLVHRMNRETFERSLLTVTHPQYEAQKFLLQKSFNKVAILNLVFWPSWLTDALSGGLIQYAPNSYYIELKPLATPSHHAESANRERSRALLREQTRYLLNNYEGLIKDIARGHGEYLHNYWRLNQYDFSYDVFTELVRESSTQLLQHKTPLELQKKIMFLIKQRVISP